MMRPTQGNRARAKLPLLAAEPSLPVSPLLEFAGWEKEGVGRASPLPPPQLSSPPMNYTAGNGHLERQATWVKLILAADSQGLWK